MRRLGFSLFRFRAGLVSILLLTGCALTPDYQRPELDVPETFSAGRAQPINLTQGDSIANLGWWEVFEDTQLQRLIRSALLENKDIDIALSLSLIHI